MGTVAVAEEFAGNDDLDELYRLEGSESEPEPEEGEGEEEDEDIEPEDIPHG